MHISIPITLSIPAAILISVLALSVLLLAAATLYYIVRRDAWRERKWGRGPHRFNVRKRSGRRYFSVDLTAPKDPPAR